MKEKISQLWLQYKKDCGRKEQEYFQHVLANYGPMMYAPSSANKPSFEGFMEWLATTSTEKGV